MDRKSKKSEKKIAQGLITFFLILAVSVIAAHAVFRRSPLNSFIMISLEVMALVFMGLILLVWMRIFLLTIIARRKFALTLEYPVDISGSEKISIIVPARNEERNIRRCLQSLRKIEYPNVEIIVVNDRSTDRTAQIIAEFAKLDSRVKLIQGKDFKDGWSGKIHAIHQGVLNACGDWFLFIDADVAIHEKAPAIALSYCLRNELKMLSLLLRPSLETFWENIIMPIGFIAFKFSVSLERVSDPDDEAATANGGFIFINAESYRAIGGFEAIKDAIQEDVAFARLAKAKKVPYRFMRGQEMGTQRWYTSFRQIWQALSKMAFTGMSGQSPVLVIRTILLLFILSILPFLVLLDQSITLVFLGSLPPPHLSVGLTPIFWLAVAQTLTILGYRFYNAVYQGLAKGYFFTHPLGSAISIGIILNAAFRSFTGRGIPWKGRTYTGDTIGRDINSAD